jgi:hypothetical protein
LRRDAAREYRRATMTARRLLVLVGLVALAFAATSPVGAAARPDAKRLGTCKAGTNKKKCKCPAGATRKKSKKGYRCEKAAPKPKPVPPTPDPVTPGPDPTPTPVTTPDKVRNDQALIDVLKGAAFYKTYSGGGFGSYAYNFLPDIASQSDAGIVFRLRYCTYYYAIGFTTDRSNYDGLWGVKEGYTVPSRPGLVVGVLQLYRQALGQQVVEANVGVENGKAQIETGNGEKYFEPGVYAYKPGQATTNCTVWEPA